jgi:serine/threonine-protein kinase RsbW
MAKRKSPGATSQCTFSEENLKLLFEAVFPADVSEIEKVVSQAMGAISRAGCAPRKKDHISLAVREALANAVIHGARSDAEQKIQICVACDEEKGVLILIKDPGTGFDPASIPSPVIGRNLFSSGGRGIFLITQLMDEVSFEEEGTLIRMRKR